MLLIDLIQKIKKSNITIIGFDSKNERNAYRIVDFIENKQIFSNVESVEVFDYLNSKSNIRDNKISDILSEDKFIIIDISTILFSKEEHVNFSDKYKLVGNFISKIQSKIYTDGSNTNVILLHQLNNSNIQPYSGIITSLNSKAVYSADIVIVLYGDEISIQKDRHPNTEKSITDQRSPVNFNSLLRDMLLDEILK